jgi:hypothetical protein
MSNLAQIGGALRRLRETCRGTTRRWRRLVVVLTLAVGTALIGGVFLAGAVYLYVAQSVAPWQAAATTGLFVAVFAVALAGAARLGRLRRPGGTDTAAPGDAEVTRTATTAMEVLLRSSNLRASDLVITGLLAGIVLGVTSELHKPDRRGARQ